MLTRSSTTAEFISAAFSDFSRVADRTIPKIRTTLDIDAIHDFRVALRRFRTIIRSLAPLMHGDFVSALKIESDWVDESFARMRNAQVLIARFEGYPDELKNATTIERQHLGDVFESEKERLINFLDSLRFSQFLQAINSVKIEDVLVGNGGIAARQELKRINKKLWKKFELEVKNSDHSELHHVRILAKRVRYLAIASEPIIGKKILERGEIAAKVQNLLGDLQDSRLMTDFTNLAEIYSFEREFQLEVISSWDKFVKRNF